MKQQVLYFNLFFILFFDQLSIAQPNLVWRNKIDNGTNFDDPNAVSIVLDQQNNVYSCWQSKSTNSTTTYGQVITKYSDNGNLIWSTRLDSLLGRPGCQPYEMKGVGSILYVSGYYRDTFGRSDIYLMAIDTSGNLLWQRVAGVTYLWGSNYFTELFTTSDEGALILGYAIQDSITRENIVLLKYDSSGNLLWKSSYNNPQYNGGDISFALYLDSMDNSYIGASSANGALNASCDMLLLKYNRFGTLLFETRLNSNSSGYNSDYVFDVNESPNHKIWITGYGGFSNSPFQNLITAKIDTSGNVLGVSSLAGYQSSVGYSITFDNNYNCFITGAAQNSQGTINSILTIKYDSLCNILWDRSFNYSNNYVAGGIENFTDSSDNEYSVGYLQDSSSKRFVIVKYDSNGLILWNYDDGPSIEVSPIYFYRNLVVNDDLDIYYSIAIRDSGQFYKIHTVKLTEQITKVYERSTEIDINIYPNPFSSFFTIDLNENVKNADIYIYDTVGNIVYKNNFSGNLFKVDGRNFNNEIYLFYIKSKEREIIKRLIAE